MLREAIARYSLIKRAPEKKEKRAGTGHTLSLRVSPSLNGITLKVR